MAGLVDWLRLPCFPLQQFLHRYRLAYSKHASPCISKKQPYAHLYTSMRTGNISTHMNGIRICFGSRHSGSFVNVVRPSRLECWCVLPSCVCMLPTGATGFQSSDYGQNHAPRFLGSVFPDRTLHIQRGQQEPSLC